MKHTIGIVSTGRFATVLKKLFSRTDQFVVLQSSCSKPVDGHTIFPLEEVLKCDIIFLCIPISVFHAFLQRHGKKIQEKALVVDVCSVKQLPATWMKDLLPKDVDILATHPVFGPFSTNNGNNFSHLPWMICPIRIQDQKRLQTLLRFFQEQSINLLEMDTKTHDRCMAHSQAIAFLFGTIGSRLGLQEGPLDTKGFSLLLENQKSVEQDSQQLFIDLFRYNDEARHMLTTIDTVLKEIREETQIV